jgi:hypothetical protein
MMPAFIIFEDINSYVGSKDQANKMRLHHGMHPHVNKCHISGGLSMVPCEVVNDHGHKMTSQDHWR